MKYFLSTTLLAVVLGCAENHSDEKKYAELSPSDIIVKIDNFVLDKQSCEDILNAVFEDLKVGRKEELAKRTVMEKKIVGEFIRSSCLYCVALKGGYTPDCSAAKRLALTMARKVTKGKLTIGAFTNQHSLAWRHIERSANMSSAVTKYFETSFSNELFISDLEIENVKKYVVHYNDIANATNALVYACASNVCRMAKSGANFVDLVMQYDKHPSRQKEGLWGDLYLSDFDDMPNVLEVVAKSHPGDIMGPIEADGGLLVLKVLVHDGLGNNSLVNTNPERFLFQRIFFELPVFFENPTDDYVRKDLLKRKMDSIVKRETKIILENSNISFPHGKNLW